MVDAEELLARVMQDWEERVNRGKTERLIVSSAPRAAYDVRREYEVSTVRHLGAHHNEKATFDTDTQYRVSRGREIVRRLAKAWGVGTHHGRGRGSGLSIPTRLQILHACVISAMTSNSRSRPWGQREIGRMQRVANYAVRRAFGMDVYIMQEHGITDAAMYQASGWRTIRDILMKLSMEWTGHVARMPTFRHPKQVLFGWIEGRQATVTGGRVLHHTWCRRGLRQLRIEEIDWFRQATDRKQWKTRIARAFPNVGMSPQHKAAIKFWAPPAPLPVDPARPAPPPPPLPAAPPAQPPGDRRYECPVCQKILPTGSQLQYHYDEEHSIRDPQIVTTLCHQCPECKGYFGCNLHKHKPICPAKLELRKALNTEFGQWLPVMYGPPPPPPVQWWIATDGSGQTVIRDGAQARIAGWGAVIFRYDGPDQLDMIPDYILHAPVVVQAWDHRWMGARELTNNTGELSAIGEAMLWLLEEAPDDHNVPVHIRYDSEYAANMARGRWAVKSNEELAHTVQELTAKVMRTRSITWEHVYGHSGVHDNELADRAANLGAQGKVSSMSRRWNAPPPAVAELAYDATDFCKKCGVRVLSKDITWHVRRCTSTAQAIPLGKEKCRKCSMLLNGSRRQHEKKCRGSSLANRTCQFCARVFPEPPEGMLSIPLGNHERYCGAAQAPGAAPPAAPMPAAPGPPGAVAQAKRQAKARAAGRGQAKAKVRVAAVRKALAKPKGKAKAHAKARLRVVAKGRGKAKARPKPRR
jgi:ribonuclease HI